MPIREARAFQINSVVSLLLYPVSLGLYKLSFSWTKQINFSTSSADHVTSAGILLEWWNEDKLDRDHRPIVVVVDDDDGRTIPVNVTGNNTM